MKLRVLHIGKSARLDALIQACARSRHDVELYALSDVRNSRLTQEGRLEVGQSDDADTVSRAVARFKPHLAVIGPEEPLAAGIADLLKERDIPCFGPTQKAAQLETSKSFTRHLLKKYSSISNPDFEVFETMAHIEDYLRPMSDFVIKPDGLTGGKGVRVSGEHIHSLKEALEFCHSIVKNPAGRVVIEERLEGEEFSLQSFCDGKNTAHTFPVQDHKRAFDGDSGPNTGGMGSYSCADHNLPFLSKDDLAEAERINDLIGKAVCTETGELFQGIVYGGFISTKKGVRVIEYNARFGDPEVMNVLPLLENDFIDLCFATIEGNIDRHKIDFVNKATVCKYIVPQNYPSPLLAEKNINVSALDELAAHNKNLHVFYGAAQGDGPDFELTGSRAIGVVGIGDTLAEAEKTAEEAACAVSGPVRHRSDVGTQRLLQKRVEHMSRLKQHGLERLKVG